MKDSNEYTYVDSVEHDGRVYVWTRDATGLTLNEHDASDFYYCFIPNNSGKPTKWRDLWGTPMKKCYFNKRWDMTQFAKTEDYVCESDVPVNYKALIDCYSDASETYPVNFCLYDIEVDFDLADGLGYPKPENPHGEINLIQCWDNVRKCYTIFGIDHLKDIVSLKDDEYPVNMVWCWDERDLLQKFARFLDPIDIFGAWFGDGFDLPYIMERAHILFDKETALTMFCRDGMKATSKTVYDDFGNERVVWQTVGRKHVDLMELYKKFIPGQRESWSLDAICTEDLGMQKVQYEDEGDLGTLYRQDPQKFYEYGLHDARLLLKLNEKHDLMGVTVGLAVQSSVLYDDVTGSVKPIEMGLLRFGRDLGNIVLPNKEHSDEAEFPGAIVYETISGRHTWVTSADLSGLYPSIMIMLGLSPETVVGQLVGEYDDYVEVMSGSDKVVTFQEKKGSKVVDEYPIQASVLKEIIKSEGLVISANGTVFNGEMGIVAQYAQDGVVRRSQARKISNENYGKNPDLHQRYDLLQKVLKIRNNSLYGCISNQYFRLFDINLAASVTITGQMISKFQAISANDEIEKLEEKLSA